MSTATVPMYADILRDVRHLDARAAPDLADWLGRVTIEDVAAKVREMAL